MEITQHLFLNLSILIIFFFLCLVVLENKRYVISKASIILYFILMLWVCIQFSLHPVSYVRFDLRVIPIVIGGLYFGIGPILVLATIILRSFYGIDMGFYQTIMLYVPLSFILWRMYPWFWKQQPLKHVLISSFMGGIVGTISSFGMGFLGLKINWMDSLFAYIVVPSSGIGIISYAIEFVKKNVEMRQQLIKAEKLKAVEQMGAAISHEIRNPLTAASGFVQLLEDDYLSRQKRKEYLSIVKEELSSAEKVIQDYLTFAKPSIEKFEELNVKNELKQIINIVLPLANQNSVEITTDFSVIGFIKGDRQKFRQCFVNVFKNAIEAMPSGGYLSISSDTSQNHITIIVKDTGLGMTIEQIERLGEPFYSTKGKNGTGLGMMVVYSIVRALDGEIRVESEIGVGTTFSFTFPTINLMMKKELYQ
ncbi:ATP-binding protein [Neobacillus sp. LXY-1]|uniref:ATP-binding protein n=1 Tax=Neobacillus sp. LXY-1 TaxID=3379133 RepID=UPI003EE0EE42